MTIIDKRRGLGEGSDAAQQAAQRAIDTNVPDHVKTGVRISGVSMGPGAIVKVPHKLGRVPNGWHTMRITGTGTGTEVTETNADANTIEFTRASLVGTLVFDFWIF
jgi:hypothetical protein